MSKTYLPYEPDQQLLLPAALQERLPDHHLAPRDRMRRKLQTRRGRQRYALRMETVEPVFGQIKQGRGFRQFLLRGLDKVNGEWSLICTGHPPRRAQTVPLWGRSVQQSSGQHVCPTHQRVRRDRGHGAIGKATRYSTAPDATSFGPGTCCLTGRPLRSWTVVGRRDSRCLNPARATGQSVTEMTS